MREKVGVHPIPSPTARQHRGSGKEGETRTQWASEQYFKMFNRHLKSKAAFPYIIDMDKNRFS